MELNAFGSAFVSAAAAALYHGADVVRVDCVGVTNVGQTVRKLLRTELTLLTRS